MATDEATAVPTEATPVGTPAIAAEFLGVHNQVISFVREATTYIQRDKDNEKVKVRIEETDGKIKEHKGFLKTTGSKVKADAKNYDATIVEKYEKLKSTYVTKRDGLANDEGFQTMLEEGAKKKQSILKSMKKMVKGKPTQKKWSPHADGYEPSSTSDDDFADAFDTLAKANADLPKIQQELEATIDLPKRQLPLIKEYNDLLLQTDQVLAQIGPIIESRQADWQNYVQAVEAELVDGKEKVAKPTMFMEAVSEYKKIRTKVAPLVGAKKKGTCAVM
eukprot:CAMPEP_0119008752 /NCGR_PEP_ID=MMETSP1176-20130426/3912_1 /TAXON_ID=265551 /ORGANISM="Synedropsis recta cf, Strain CCMP1620" /LENGTH=276 /DNA_ID=CAMNT_0006961147 /DNA_START=33 /DNA_END=863 /DNA_ORIENTATION=-